MQSSGQFDPRESSNPPLRWIPVVPLVAVAVIRLEGVVEVVVTLSIGQQREER